MKPLCECHGEAMSWQKEGRILRGGHWRCTVRKREYDRERKRRIYNHEDRWRRYIGQERPKALLAQRDKLAHELDRLEAR